MESQDAERLEKRRFVQEELTGMLRTATGGLAAECFYEHDGADEVVKVLYGQRRGEREVISVNVTCDSLWAIAKDVMRAVARRYE